MLNLTSFWGVRNCKALSNLPKYHVVGCKESEAFLQFAKLSTYQHNRPLECSTDHCQIVERIHIND